MKMAIFKSVTKATLSSVMIFISIVRLGMLAYPQNPVMAVSPEAVTLPAVQRQAVKPAARRRIIMGKNTIKNLQKAK
ncbi:MAG: hypothetical protein QM492_05010 [Rhodobacterales bacterium]